MKVQVQERKSELISTLNLYQEVGVTTSLMKEFAFHILNQRYSNYRVPSFSSGGREGVELEYFWKREVIDLLRKDISDDSLILQFFEERLIEIGRALTEKIYLNLRKSGVQMNQITLMFLSLFFQKLTNLKCQNKIDTIFGLPIRIDNRLKNFELRFKE